MRTVTTFGMTAVLLGACVEYSPNTIDHDTVSDNPTVTEDVELPALCINELMPSNTGSLQAVNGSSPDWLEIAVVEGSHVLQGWTLLSGREQNQTLDLTGRTLSTDAPLLLYSTEGDPENGFDWKLDSLGEQVGLMDPNGNTQWVEWSAVADDYALFRASDCCSGPDCWMQGLYGSPGLPNN